MKSISGHVTTALAIHQRVWLFFTVLIAGGLASLAKTFDLLSGFIVRIEGQIGGDIVLHLLVATLLGISASWAGRESRLLSRATENPWIPSRKQFGLISLSAVLISLDESMQYFAQTRTFSIHDWLANMFGLFIGVFIYLFVCICRSHYSRG